MAGEFVKEREENALVSNKKNVKGKERYMFHSRFACGSSSPENTEDFFNNYKKPLRCYLCGKAGHIWRYFQALASNMAHTEKVVKEEQG